MLLFIQVPCLNEAQTITQVIQEIPPLIQGIEDIEICIIDDGSSDETVALARKAGADHIIEHVTNQGLGTSFRDGMSYAYAMGADILVNTDGDNQYPGKYIPALVAPILDGSADIVVGNRQTKGITHFSSWKKFLQWLGTGVIRGLLQEPNVKDAVSGFRAYNRKAMRELNVVSTFSYVLDTTIQASAKGLRLASVDIKTNPPTRPSRLFRSNFHHIRKSVMDIIRVYAMYKGMRFFFWVGTIVMIIGAVPIVRYLYDYFFLPSHGDGKIQSLTLGTALIVISVLMFALGIIADLLSKNRMLLERILNEEKDK